MYISTIHLKFLLASSRDHPITLEISSPIFLEICAPSMHKINKIIRVSAPHDSAPTRPRTDRRTSQHPKAASPRSLHHSPPTFWIQSQLWIQTQHNTADWIPHHIKRFIHSSLFITPDCVFNGSIKVTIILLFSRFWDQLHFCWTSTATTECSLSTLFLYHPAFLNCCRLLLIVLHPLRAP